MKSFIYLGFFLLYSVNAFALDCPKAPEQINKDWEVEVNAAVARIGPAKGAELNTKTKNATNDLLGKLPDAGRVYLEQMMFSAYCSALRDDKTIKEADKARLLKDYRNSVMKTLAEKKKPASQQKKTTAKDQLKLKLPTFTEKVDKVSFSLGERGFTMGYRIEDLEKKPREPFNLNNFSPLRVYVKDRMPYADVKVYGGSGFPPIEIQNNQLLNKPPAWDFNSNEKALEIVNEDYLPIYQFFYKSPSHIVVNGAFPFPGGLILASESGAVLNPTLPTTFKLRRIFKYPSWKYPGKFDEATDR